jgi:hypothetical protein
MNAFQTLSASEIIVSAPRPLRISGGPEKVMHEPFE